MRGTFEVMALLQNPYRLNYKATTLADQLESTRALDWDLQYLVWSGHATGQRMLSSGSAASVTRDHVAWAARCRGGPPGCDSRIRVVMAQQNLVARALLLEPVIAARIPGEDAPRLALIAGVSKSAHITSWGDDQNLLLQALAKAIRTDPSALVRLEVLRALGTSPIPLGWVPTLLDAIARTEAVLAEAPFPQKERQALSMYLKNVAARLVSIQAEAAQAAAVNTPIPSTTSVNPPPANVPDPKSYLHRGRTTAIVLALGAVGGLVAALVNPATSSPASIS